MQDRLLNKFQNLEEKYHDKDIKYKLTKKEIALIKTAGPVAENFGPLKFLLSLSRYTGKKTAAVTGSLTSAFFKGAHQYSKRIASRIGNNKKEVEQELFRYVNKLETDFDKKQLALNEQKLNQEQHLKEIKRKLLLPFSVKNASCSLKVEGETEDLDERILIDLQTFGLFSQKMSEIKLDQNIFGLCMESTINNDLVTHKLTFELKTKGLKWTLFFSKFIIKDITNGLSAWDPVVKGEHIFNASLGRDKFILNIKRNARIKEKEQSVLREQVIASVVEEQRPSLSELGI